MRKTFIMFVVLFTLLLACSGESLPKGVQKLRTVHKLSQPDKIEVLEFMWLGCPHCRDFHPNWVSLKKQFGDKVSFRSVPAPFDNWVFDARSYLTMQEMGLMDDGLLANYYEVRQGPQGQGFGSDAHTVAAWLQQRYGSSVEDFLTMFGSPLIDSKLSELKDLLTKYPITGVPSLLVSIPSRSETYFVAFQQGAEKTVSDLVTKALAK